MAEISTERRTVNKKKASAGPGADKEPRTQDRLHSKLLTLTMELRFTR